MLNSTRQNLLPLTNYYLRTGLRTINFLGSAYIYCSVILENYSRHTIHVILYQIVDIWLQYMAQSLILSILTFFLVEKLWYRHVKNEFNVWINEKFKIHSTIFNNIIYYLLSECLFPC